jgi:glycosyltransferase 2 family protein
MTPIAADVPRRRLAAWLIPVLGYLVSIASLIWVYWGFDWKTEAPKFAQANWWWVSLALLSDVAVYFCQGWRWSLLLRPVAPVRWLRSTQAVFIGLLANEVLPFRTGELVRGYVQSLWARIPFSVVVSSMVVERLFDGIILVAGFYVTTFFVEVPRYLRDISLSTGVVLAVAAMMVAVVMFLKHHAHAAVLRSRWAAMLWHVVEGLHEMGNSRWFCASALVSVLYLALQVVPVYALMRAYNLDLSIGVAAVVLVILRIGTIVPQAPGNVGGFQFFTVVALQLFDVDKSAATSFATILFAAVTVPLWLGGAIAAAAAGVRLKDLQRQASSSLQSSAAAGGQTAPRG